MDDNAMGKAERLKGLCVELVVDGDGFGSMFVGDIYVVNIFLKNKM